MRAVYNNVDYQNRRQRRAEEGRKLMSSYLVSARGRGELLACGQKLIINEAVLNWRHR